MKISRNEKLSITCPNLKKIRKKMNYAILSKKLKTPATSPAFKLHLRIFLESDKIIPIIKQGIAKKIESKLSVPSQKEREISTPVIPDIRLSIPLTPKHR